MCVALPVPEIEFLGGGCEPPSWEEEAMEIVDGTVGKSVGDFL